MVILGINLEYSDSSEFTCFWEVGHKCHFMVRMLLIVPLILIRRYSLLSREYSGF